MRRSHFLQAAARSGGGAILRVATRNEPLATHIELAGDSSSRKRGLLGRHALAPGTALAIAPTWAIHTFGMRFPIDVVFAARDGRIVKVRRAVPPSRICLAWGAFAAIELAAGGADDVSVGETLTVTET